MNEESAPHRMFDSSKEPSFPKHGPVDASLAFAVLALLAVKLHLLFLLNINWDEFVFLALRYDFDRENLSSALQTFHVHLIGWIEQVGTTSVDQVLAGRIQAFFLRVGSCAAIFAIGLRLFGRTGALVSVGATLCVSYVLAHGESFRADPIIAFLFLCAASIVICGRQSVWTAVIAGALMGLAFAVSIKVAFYLPTFALVLAARMLSAESRKAAALQLLAFFVVFGSVAYLLVLAHSTLLPENLGIQSATRHASGAANVMIGSSQPATRAVTFAWDRAYWLSLLLGCAVAMGAVAYGGARRRETAIIVLSMALPVVSIWLYRNSFPYYYVCIVPGASLAIGLLVAWSGELLPQRRFVVPLVAVGLMVPMYTNAGMFYLNNRYDGIEPQRHLLDGIAQVFPHPVPYVDRCSMVSNYPKVGLFMSTAMMNSYRSRGEPVMRNAFKQQQPHFLITNSPGLWLSEPWEVVRRTGYPLLQPDFEYLRSNFIPHWGSLWVRGVALPLPTDDAVTFEIELPGPYTLEGPGPVVLDDVLRNPGDVIDLDAGWHQAKRSAETNVFALRIGEHLRIPSGAPPGSELFTGLGFRRQ